MTSRSLVTGLKPSPSTCGIEFAMDRYERRALSRCKFAIR
jgi:hypothetical protein